MQNTIAALIDGNTVHHWAGIPINAALAADKVTTKSGSGDVDDLFERALSMRWLIVNEVSSVFCSAYWTSTCVEHAVATLMHDEEIGLGDPWAASTPSSQGIGGSARR